MGFYASTIPVPFGPTVRRVGGSSVGLLSSSHVVSTFCFDPRFSTPNGAQQRLSTFQVTLEVELPRAL
jgi:hypothetical protein